MQCREFAVYSERWMEGERDPAAAEHVQACAGCRALVADLEAIERSAVELAEVAPPERVWVALRNQLEAEGIIHQPEEAVAGAATSRPGFFSGLRPAVAGAYLTLVLLVSGVALFRVGIFDTGPGPTVAHVADPSDGVMLELAELAKQAAPVVRERNPIVAASYKQNLEIIDNAIAMCEKTVREEPRNQMARDYLMSVYQQKADLLSSMSERGSRGD
jgi:hypothetical protein